ncbi:MAG TPA: dihydrofolate reductase family protein [Casimicrobiaceae bacterium]
MRRLKLFIAASLDGYIAGRGGDISWLFRDGDYGYEAFFAGIDTVLSGRRTYEAALSFEQWPYPDRNVVVFTRGNTLRIVSPNTVATSRAPAEILAELRAREGRDLWLVGGGELVRACLDARLIDDVIVSIHPILLGEGVPIVAPGAARTPLTLTAERRYPSGLVQLTYRVPRD